MKNPWQDIRHPLFGTSITNWFRLLVDNGGVDRGYFLRCLFVTFIAIIALPARILSSLIYDKKIARTRISSQPIFIIGHWRSGTTFLHELMSKDPNFAYVSVWNTLLPYNFLLLENIKSDLAKFLPTTRPMDMMKIDIDGPYEDDAGLAAIGRLSFFHCFHFSRHAKRQFRQSVLFEGLSEKERALWKKNYMYLLKAVTFSHNGKRLILKNPANTARIMTLLELFPDARFVHIYRSPYLVYHSTKKLHKRVLDMFAFQKATEDEIEDGVINDYIALMKSYFLHKDKIPKGQLAEIRYEDFISDPLKSVQKIYADLGLTGFEQAKPFMQAHLDQQKSYVKNVYKIEPESISKVDKYWGFAVKQWGYKPPK